MNIKSITKKALEIAFGKPEAHNPQPRMNRKQKRSYYHQLRKKKAAKARRKHEGRG